MAREQLDSGQAVDANQLHVMRAELDDSRSPVEVAACAIAAGLCRDPESTEALLEKVEDLHQEELGLAALGLGMNGDVSSASALDEVLLDVDGAHLRSRITRASVAELQLAPGTPVHALIKSVALAGDDPG